MEPEASINILKLIPDAVTATAVIGVVIIFLKYLEKQNQAIKEITETFSDQTAANQKAFQEQVNNLSSQYHLTQKSFQEQIQKLIESHLQISVETVQAVKSLEQAVRTVQDKVGSLPDYRNNPKA
jgi:predicted PurR-regulated permease PerM